MTTHSWLEGPRGRGLAVCIAGLGVFLAWFGAIQPALDWYHGRQQYLVDRQDTLEHLRNVAAQLPVLQGDAARDRARTELADSEMLSGATDGVAAAQFLQKVESIASGRGARLTAVETPAAETVKDWRKISLRVSMRATAPTVMDFLRAVQTETPRILVNDLEFHCDAGQRPSDACVLMASMLLSAYKPVEKG
ncbi:MAG TPA: type II secretion system protein GspM [Rhodopila sp.]|uniref:type II secretion system protein GspM n=1 Tax=Rhodopila sp. TaxID=2480087 RepID=UPI002CBD43E2|nr:type II secretion system protein GspM [Rhodopila sp.]HVY16313.1 type II secretion system protein GspM [Rhodopila sp.]